MFIEQKKNKSKNKNENKNKNKNRRNNECEINKYRTITIFNLFFSPLYFSEMKLLLFDYFAILQFLFLLSLPQPAVLVFLALQHLKMKSNLKKVIILFELLSLISYAIDVTNIIILLLSLL